MSKTNKTKTKQETMMHKLLSVILLALVAGLVQTQNQIDFGVEDRHSDPKSIIPFGNSAFSEYSLDFFE